MKIRSLFVAAAVAAVLAPGAAEAASVSPGASGAGPTVAVTNCAASYTDSGNKLTLKDTSSKYQCVAEVLWSSGGTTKSVAKITFGNAWTGTTTRSDIAVKENAKYTLRVQRILSTKPIDQKSLTVSA